MKKVIVLTVALALCGCTTNGVYDPGKTWALVGAVAVGSIVASQSGGSSTPAKDDCYIVIHSDGTSSQVC